MLFCWKLKKQNARARKDRAREQEARAENE
jgi:hypothetical protein